MSESVIRELVSALKREVRNGTVSAATEHHLRREFAAIGWNRDLALHLGKLDDEVRRLETEAWVLKGLRRASAGGHTNAVIATE